MEAADALPTHPQYFLTLLQPLLDHRYILSSNSEIWMSRIRWRIRISYVAVQDVISNPCLNRSSGHLISNSSKSSLPRPIFFGFATDFFLLWPARPVSLPFYKQIICQFSWSTSFKLFPFRSDKNRFLRRCFFLHGRCGTFPVDVRFASGLII